MEDIKIENEVNAPQEKDLALVQEIVLSFFLDEQLTDEQTDFLKQNYKSIQDYLDAPLNSPADVEAKKIFAKVILLAKQKGILPESFEQLIPQAQPNETLEEAQERIEETAETVATAVDEGFDQVKTAYMVGTGKMTAEEKIDYFVDKAAVRVSSIADKLVHKGFKWLTTKGASIVERTFPKLTPVVKVAKCVLRFVEPVARKAVRKGVKLVAEGAKNVAKTVVKAATWVGEKVKQGASWLGRKFTSAKQKTGRELRRIGEKLSR